ncbi:MAG: hypothetical protein ABRQ39_21115 [Candidatus Eremiobacterota bacterium]
MDKKPFIRLDGMVPEKNTQKKTDSLEWLLSANNCIILGEAGSGKTTLAEQWELETGKKIIFIPLSQYE